MKRLILCILIASSIGCPTKEETRAVIKEELDCFTYKNNCFCSLNSGDGTVYSVTWAPMEVCE